MRLRLFRPQRNQGEAAHPLALLRARRQRPRRRRAAECGQQFPPSDADCHLPLPCEVTHHWSSVSEVRIISGGLIELVGPSVDEGALVEVVNGSHDAVLEFLFGGDADVAQNGTGQL